MQAAQDTKQTNKTFHSRTQENKTKIWVTKEAKELSI